jgi:hypothetical protein
VGAPVLTALWEALALPERLALPEALPLRPADLELELLPAADLLAVEEALCS